MDNQVRKLMEEVSQGRKRFRQRVSKDQSMLGLWERIEAALSRIKI